MLTYFATQSGFFAIWRLPFIILSLWSYDTLLTDGKVSFPLLFDMLLHNKLHRYDKCYEENIVVFIQTTTIFFVVSNVFLFFKGSKTALELKCYCDVWPVWVYSYISTFILYFNYCMDVHSR